MAGIQRICERELDLEPDGGELPGVLARGVGQLGWWPRMATMWPACVSAASAGSLRRVLGARVERVYWLYRKAL